MISRLECLEVDLRSRLIRRVPGQGATQSIHTENRRLIEHKGKQEGEDQGNGHCDRKCRLKPQEEA